MLSTERLRPQKERSLNALGLHVVANLQATTPPSHGHTGYRVGWEMGSLQDDSKRTIAYHVGELKDGYGKEWGEVLHGKVKQLLDQLGYWLD